MAKRVPKSYQTGTRVVSSRRTGPIDPEEKVGLVRGFKLMWADGLFDTEIALKLDLVPKTIASWRQSEGYLSNYPDREGLRRTKEALDGKD